MKVMMQHWKMSITVTQQSQSSVKLLIHFLLIDSDKLATCAQ